MNLGDYDLSPALRAEELKYIEARRKAALLDQAVKIARVTYEANRAYCEATLFDYSFLPWDAAPLWQQETNVAGVLGILDGSITTDEQSHASWLAVKVAEGWTYGPIKDPVAKTHPCMVPYAQLPAEQRRKDALFRAVVHALSADLP